MDLKDFIQQTIIQIAEATVQSQKEVRDLGGVVNPKLIYTDEFNNHGFLFSNNGVVQVVHFDVALTITEGTGTKGGMGVNVGVVNLGSTGQSKNETSSVSRIKFSIPLQLPNEN